MSAALAVDRISVNYGGVSAVSELSLEVSGGEIVGLIGPNGAGKTSAIDAITGFARASGGEVRLGEHRLDGLRPARRAELGLGRTFQTLELFEDLTVEENMLVAARQHGVDDPHASVQEIAELFGISQHLQVLTRSLSVGTRRLVAVARAVARGSEILLLDEPAAGLDSSESEELGRRLRDLRAKGIGMLLVDHDMTLVLSICDRIVVLDRGCGIADGTPEEIRKSPAVIAAYLGED